jgi:phage shock protein A
MPTDDFNYFNYYTEIEDHFRAARGSGLFLLSPLDWALIETWKENGIPLAAVLRGIDRAFEKWHAKKSKTHQINSIAYCAQAVMEEARRADTPREASPVSAPFTGDELAAHLRAAAAKLPPAFAEITTALTQLATDAPTWVDRLEELEQHLSALEQKMVAMARAAQSEADLLKARQHLDSQLKPYRGKMSAAELMLIERKFLDQRLFEDTGLPRLSLFYLG